MNEVDPDDDRSPSGDETPHPSRQFRPRLLAPHERYPDELLADRIQLARSMDEHLDVLKDMLSSDLYALDLYVTGALQRSYHLVEGFLLAWDHWNVIAATPLVRLQIDSLVRCAYLCQRRDSDAVVLEVMGGTQQLIGVMCHATGALLSLGSGWAAYKVSDEDVRGGASSQSHPDTSVGGERSRKPQQPEPP